LLIPRVSDAKAFECSIAASTPAITSSSGLTVKADMDYEDAHENLNDYDVLIIPGGTGVDSLLKSADETTEPINLIRAFAALQTSDPSKERTLLTIGTGSLLCAKAGILQGLAATTHPDYYTKLEILCKEAARRGDLEQTDVMEENYVVNNARFELGEKLEENPFILSKRPDGRRKSIARKGSNAWKESVKRRESQARRADLRLGGLRVISSGGVTSGLDASLYLVAAMVSHDSAIEVGRVMQYSWTKGVTVDGIDV
jgi:putative intracellular protease/amidase